MKKYYVYFIKCVCFLTLLGWVVLSVYNVLKWKDTIGDYLSSVEQLYATPKDLIDVVFVEAVIVISESTRQYYGGNMG